MKGLQELKTYPLKFLSQPVTKNIFVPELGRKIKLKLSVNGLKTIDKVGLTAYLKKRNLKLSDLM